MLQFIVKMSMAIVLAIAAVVAVGGIGRSRPSSPSSMRRTTPRRRVAVVVSFPPGMRAGCRSRPSSCSSASRGGHRRIPARNRVAAAYIAQRIFASKTRRMPCWHALFQRRALRATPLAVDPRRALRARALPARRDRSGRQSGFPNSVTCKPWSIICRRPLRGLMLAALPPHTCRRSARSSILARSYLTNDLYRASCVRTPAKNTT